MMAPLPPDPQKPWHQGRKTYAGISVLAANYGVRLSAFLQAPDQPLPAFLLLVGEGIGLAFTWWARTVSKPKQ